MGLFHKSNHLEKKYSNKKLYLSLTIGMLGILLTIVGGSYAFLTHQVVGTKTNIISAGTLELDFSDESEAIVMTNAVPQTASNAIGNNTEFTFKITNTGTLPVNYKIKFKNVCTANTPISSTLTPDVCVPIEYVRLAVKYGDGVYEVKIPVDGIIELNDLTVLEGQATSETYSIKLWLDESTPNDYSANPSQGVTQKVAFAGQLELYGEQVLR